MGDEDGSTARDGLSSEISADTRGGGGAPLDKRSQFIRQNRPATAGGAALRPENNAAAAAVLVAESSEPLVPSRAAPRNGRTMPRWFTTLSGAISEGASPRRCCLFLPSLVVLTGSQRSQQLAS